MTPDTLSKRLTAAVVDFQCQECAVDPALLTEAATALEALAEEVATLTEARDQYAGLYADLCGDLLRLRTALSLIADGEMTEIARMNLARIAGDADLGERG